MCSGNGQCLGDVSSCDCDPGFAGVECEVDIDDCMAVNYSGNGQCVGGISSFSCDYTAGFTGLLCEIDISDSEFSEGNNFARNPKSQHNMGDL